MTTDETEVVTRHAEWADVGRRWVQIPKEERIAIHPSITNPVRAEIQAYQERRERKNRAAEARKLGVLESEAWAEYEERERAAKLARAIRKLRTRK